MTQGKVSATPAQENTNQFTSPSPSSPPHHHHHLQQHATITITVTTTTIIITDTTDHHHCQTLSVNVHRCDVTLLRKFPAGVTYISRCNGVSQCMKECVSDSEIEGMRNGYDGMKGELLAR